MVEKPIKDVKNLIGANYTKKEENLLILIWIEVSPRSTGYSLPTMTSVALIIATTSSPTLMFNSFTDSLVITAVISVGASIFIFTLAVIGPSSTFSTFPLIPFLALIFMFLPHKCYFILNVYTIY